MACGAKVASIAVLIGSPSAKAELQAKSADKPTMPAFINGFIDVLLLVVQAFSDPCYPHSSIENSALQYNYLL
ncbi:hypothetical protein D3C73_690140 [compost metagenome]